MRLLIFVSMMTLAACQSSGHPQSVDVPGEHTLDLEQSLPLPDGSTLTYVRVVADSRCRPDVQCIRAGDADIELRWNPTSGEAQLAPLNSDPRNQQQAPNAVQFGHWQVALKKLDWQTPPAATVSIQREK